MKTQTPPSSTWAMQNDWGQSLARKAAINRIAICECGFLFDFQHQTKHAGCPRCNSANWKHIPTSEATAAPELLEALKACLHYAETPGDFTQKEALEMMADCGAAISKATGEKP